MVMRHRRHRHVVGKDTEGSTGRAGRRTRFCCARCRAQDAATAVGLVAAPSGGEAVLGGGETAEFSDAGFVTVAVSADGAPAEALSFAPLLVSSSAVPGGFAPISGA